MMVEYLYLNLNKLLYIIIVYTELPSFSLYKLKVISNRLPLFSFSSK